MTTTTTRTYQLPNTKTENDRLELQHNLLLKTFHGLYRAPLSPPTIHRVLDIGCGTCNWPIAFAHQHPHAHVLGVDIESKPEAQQKAPFPQNFTLHLADLEEEATWKDLGQFEFIHARFLAVVVRDWPKMIQRCLEHLAPGGWLELQDLYLPPQCLDCTPEEAAQSKVLEWSRLMGEASSKLGLKMDTPGTFPQVLQTVGFQDVKGEDFKYYTGPWDESSEETMELGRLGQECLIMGTPGFSETLFTTQLGWTEQQHAEYVAEVVQEMREVKFKTFIPVKICYGRKPAAAA